MSPNLFDKIYFRFASYIKLIKDIEHGYSTMLTSWLLMAWRSKKPGHQQLYYQAMVNVHSIVCLCTALYATMWVPLKFDGVKYLTKTVINFDLCWTPLVVMAHVQTHAVNEYPMKCGHGVSSFALECFNSYILKMHLSTSSGFPCLRWGLLTIIAVCHWRDAKGRV